MVTPEWPEHCPCPGWGADRGEQIPERPDCYNHNYVAHQIVWTGEEFVVAADLARIKTQAEMGIEKDIKDAGEAYLEESLATWQDTLQRTAGPLHELLEMHDPWITQYAEVQCSTCRTDDGANELWPCKHWTLLTQLEAGT